MLFVMSLKQVINNGSLVTQVKVRQSLVHSMRK